MDKLPDDVISGRRGSALILVIVVTTLLAVIGVLFVMTTRVRDITSSNMADSRDIDSAVQSVAGAIKTTLKNDLAFPLQNTKTYDYSDTDTWLADLEPNPTTWTWDHITNPASLFSGATTATTQPITGTVSESTAAAANTEADADGDGVADSKWAVVPGIVTGRGQPVYAAVRIIDNCAMLNLNNAYCFDLKTMSGVTSKSAFLKFWYPIGGSVPYLGSIFSSSAPYGEGGRYLSEINYLPFLRGSDLSSYFGTDCDGWYGLLGARGFAVLNASGIPTSQMTPAAVHAILMTIENPGASTPFDMGDELEIRNRFILTSRVESRFERKDVANYTLDAGGGTYGSLEIPRGTGFPLSDWMVRMNPANFEDPAGSKGDDVYKFDRRHLCTFYSFDRPIRTGVYTFESALSGKSEDIEKIFRPLNNRPINLRLLTDTTNPDNIVVPKPANLVNARRSILHLLYALRDKYRITFDTMGLGLKAKPMAAQLAAKNVANLIDYLDDNTASVTGPFGTAAYGSQKNSDLTYINKTIVDQLIKDVSGANYASVNNASFDFGLTSTDILYGYEQHPFISTIYVRVNSLGNADQFALELLNPYPEALSLNGWSLVFENAAGAVIGNYSISGVTMPAAVSPALPTTLVLRSASTIPATGSVLDIANLGEKAALTRRIILKRNNPVISTDIVEITANWVNNPIPSMAAYHFLKKQESLWKFSDAGNWDHNYIPSDPSYIPTVAVSGLGTSNGVTTTAKSWPVSISNQAQPLYTVGDFQKVLFISEARYAAALTAATAADVNSISLQIARSSSETEVRYNPELDALEVNPLAGYFCMLNRDAEGSLPGRININTASKYVIAAAIPPQLVLTSASDPNDSLKIAEQIIAGRPYTSLGKLLNKVPALKKYMQAGVADIGEPGKGNLEETDWIYNRLANIFTVRSDTFTAYILVRLGENGPQRRMIAIFDRSNVWTKYDQPKLVALHPVPDPR